jgi:hypothetical protein
MFSEHRISCTVRFTKRALSPARRRVCIETFNARFRDDLLNGKKFYSLAEAGVVVENWRPSSTPSDRVDRSAIARLRRSVRSPLAVWPAPRTQSAPPAMLAPAKEAMRR